MGYESHIREEGTWFGPPDRPLFGRVTLPSGTEARGGVVLVPPIGRESRLARRSLRTLGYSLAREGFVLLRFDHYGTGDSSGFIGDKDLAEAWAEGVEQALSYVRSFGVSSVSVVALRLGATIFGAAAMSRTLDIDSLVMWDPCESGRSYLREARALAALRRDELRNELGEPLDMSEFSYGDETKSHINSFTLLGASESPLASRLLIVTRANRSVSSQFRERWATEQAEWYVTDEQEAMLDTEVPSSVSPTSTLEQIRKWLCEMDVTTSRIELPRSVNATLIPQGDGEPVSEAIVELGPRKLFGILCKPTGPSHGPLIVMVNGYNEDHVGPSRAWVELSRRWASAGLQCIRFDFREVGESPWVLGDPTADRDVHEDVRAAIQALSANNNSVLVGLCSGAQVGLDIALELKITGLVVVNPRLGRGLVGQAVLSPPSTAPAAFRQLSRRVEVFLQRNRWISKFAWQIARLILPSPYVGRVRKALARNRTKTLLIVNDDEISPFPWIPYLGTLDRRRLVSSEYRKVMIVPELDHDFLSVSGRQRALAAIDSFVSENFATLIADNRQAPMEV
jgi:alpha-beta hydrolase superfamily lysophospholipase